MSEPIGVGDWVECVDQEWIGGEEVHFGGIYCVEEIHGETTCTHACEECGSMVGFNLVSVPRDPETCWCVHQFRPIYRPSASLIESLKCPVLIGIDLAHGDDRGTKVTVKVREDGRREVIDIEYLK